MPVAPRAYPADYFSTDVWRSLTERSRWRGLWLVAHCWGVIGLAMLMGVLWPVAIPLAVVIIGTRQLGLFILMHDAAHGLLHSNRRINDGVGRWLCSSSLGEYRPYHLQHHRFVQQAEDPDLGLSAPFPISRASLKRKLLRDLTGQTFYKQRIAPLLTAPAKASPPDRNRLRLWQPCGSTGRTELYNENRHPARRSPAWASLCDASCGIDGHNHCHK